MKTQSKRKLIFNLLFMLVILLTPSIAIFGIFGLVYICLGATIADLLFIAILINEASANIYN